MKSKLHLEKACSKYGAQMGRPNILPENTKAEGKLHLTRLDWHDWDYDSGGAYWGKTEGESMYCCWGNLAEVDARVFVRADSREKAKELVRVTLPNVRFYR